MNNKLDLMIGLLKAEGADVSRIDPGGETNRVKCPWHDDRRSSGSAKLWLSGWFKCYSCGVAGDVWEVLQQARGLTFPEAATYLADLGIFALAPDRQESTTYLAG